MPRLRTLGTITTIVVLLAACEAPQVSRAAPTPLFHKSGEALCRPEGQPVNATYPARLPICEAICSGEMQVANAADIVICPPVVVPRQPTVPDDGGQPGRGGQPGGQPGGPQAAP